MLNQFDIAFIIDTTGSMGSFISAAKREMTRMLQGLRDIKDIDMQVGIVEYKDHPPQDSSFVTKVHPFTNKMERVQNGIDSLSPSGGGDHPEAVFDGVVAAAELPWRANSRRLAVLLGDAPPHGHTTGSCTCGLTADKATCKLEEQRICLFSIPLAGDTDLVNSFTKLAILTGGACFTVGSGDKAIEAISKIVNEEFGKLGFDEQVFSAWQKTNGEISPEEMAQKLDSGLGSVYESLGRLGSRKLLEVQ